MEEWLATLGITAKLRDLRFQEGDVGKLTELAFNTPSLDLLLSLALVPGDRQAVGTIYRHSF
ncbi:hypothetical protein SDD30_11125 [Moorella naiadis]